MLAIRLREMKKGQLGEVRMTSLGCPFYYRWRQDGDMEGLSKPQRLDTACARRVIHFLIFH